MCSPYAGNTVTRCRNFGVFLEGASNYIVTKLKQIMHFP